MYTKYTYTTSSHLMMKGSERREDDKKIYDIEVPSLTKDDISVTVEGFKLMIQAEKFGTSFIDIEERADERKIQASVANGVLTITIPDREDWSLEIEVQ